MTMIELKGEAAWIEKQVKSPMTPTCNSQLELGLKLETLTLPGTPKDEINKDT